MNLLPTFVNLQSQSTRFLSSLLDPLGCQSIYSCSVLSLTRPGMNSYCASNATAALSFFSRHNFSARKNGFALSANQNLLMASDDNFKEYLFSFYIHSTSIYPTLHFFESIHDTFYIEHTDMMKLHRAALLSTLRVLPAARPRSEAEVDTLVD